MNVSKMNYKVKRQMIRNQKERGKQFSMPKIPEIRKTSSLLTKPKSSCISATLSFPDECSSSRKTSFFVDWNPLADFSRKSEARYSPVQVSGDKEKNENKESFLTQTASDIAMVSRQCSNKRWSSLTSDLWTPTNKTRKTPKTSCSSKFKNSDHGGCILAVTEGRGQARGEVGIASIHPQRALLILCQISDGQRYINSLTKMNVFDFSEVIVPNTFVDGECPNKLYSDIRSRFPNATLTSVQRRHFSEALGDDLVRRYCSPESATVMTLLRDKFYALSAAAALIKYVEFTQSIILSPNTLKIEYQGTDDIMLIDLDTANRLELITCMNHPETNRANSLMGVINHCRTKAGVRLLRANILQPFFDLNKIINRINCVEELVNDSILFCGLENVISSFTNVESLLNLWGRLPQQDGLRMAEHHRKCTLLLKTTLDLLPQLISYLEIGKSACFRQFFQILKDPRFDRMRTRISETIFENARIIKGSVAAHLHGCFAIKPGVNGLLDVAKKTYCEIVQEITDHVAELCGRYDLPLKVSFTASKGFHLRCPLLIGGKLIRKNNLPEEFIMIQKSKTAFNFYTAHLVALDKRSQNVLDEIKLITNAILFELLADIRHEIRCLFDLSEIIAELDVVLTFARVSSTKGYTKPNFGCRLDLVTSRHPILDATRVDETVPNDVFADDEKNFIILTGPNQSGKSIYIRQVALLQIMAQIGCFVPAAKATFKLVNRIFSRIGFDDCLESNACTMMVELRDVEYIRQNLTEHSMVIIDELCRGTSMEEGTHLAFAICEQILDFSAFVFFTTHYLFLTRLEEMYPNVVNRHFDCDVKVSECGNAITSFKHILKPGTTRADSYGLEVTKSTSFPRAVWFTANEIAMRLRHSRKPQMKISRLLSQYKLALKFKEELLKTEDQLDREKLVNLVQMFKPEYLNLTKRFSDLKMTRENLKIECKKSSYAGRGHRKFNTMFKCSKDFSLFQNIHLKQIYSSESKRKTISQSTIKILRMKIIKKYRKLCENLKKRQRERKKNKLKNYV